MASITDLRYKDFDEFKEVFDNVAQLDRTSLSLTDYIKFMEDKGQTVVMSRILIKKSNDSPLIDLFDLYGKLKTVAWTVKEVSEWDVASVWQAYRGGGKTPWFNYNNCNFNSQKTTRKVRRSLHAIEDARKDGCNLLFNWSKNPINIAFFNYVQPAHVEFIQQSTEAYR